MRERHRDIGRVRLGENRIFKLHAANKLRTRIKRAVNANVRANNRVVIISISRVIGTRECARTPGRRAIAKNARSP